MAQVPHLLTSVHLWQMCVISELTSRYFGFVRVLDIGSQPCVEYDVLAARFCPTRCDPVRRIS